MKLKRVKTKSVKQVAELSEALGPPKRHIEADFTGPDCQQATFTGRVVLTKS